MISCPECAAFLEECPCCGTWFCPVCRVTDIELESQRRSSPLKIEVCDRHGRVRCDDCRHIEDLEERLAAVRAIVEVIDQHNELDHTTLTQLYLALDGKLEGR